MKSTITILLALLIWMPSNLSAQDKEYEKEINKHRKKLHKEFKSPKTSPLKEDYKQYDHLEYFDIDKKYCVTAKLERTPDAKEFEMSTSSGKKKIYKQYAILHFEIDEKAYQLSVYQSLRLMKMAKYKDYLFLPFKDHTSGNETYGGGRYIETTLPDGDEMIIDFNKAFNPYCAYHSSGWNCPLVPDENYLEVEVLAGVKAWH